jgi:diguanylate cyclase (GGDEF)-like protein
MDFLNTNKILVIDDDQEWSQLLVHRLIESGYDAKSASSGEDGLEQIQHFNPDLIILDLEMPDLNGFEVLKRLRQSQVYTSVILASGESSSQAVCQGLDLGADDYVKKPFEFIELEARVRCQLRTKVIRDKLRASNEKLMKLATTDELTGLFNMRAFFDQFDEQVDRARRTESELCVMMLDMDNFKSINDRADHIFGSEVLARMGRIIQSTLRKTDMAARYGGDEFIVLLNPCHLIGAQAVAEKLMSKINHDSVQNNPFGLKISVSIGFSIFKPSEQDLTQEQMLKLADKALYRAKKLGRHRAHFILPPNNISPLADDGLQPSVRRYQIT